MDSNNDNKVNKTYDQLEEENRQLGLDIAFLKTECGYGPHFTGPPGGSAGHIFNDYSLSSEKLLKDV